MQVFLGILGRQGLFLKIKDQKILKEVSFSDADQNHLSSKMAAAYQELFPSALEQKEITALFGLSGPASFTALRMSASFLKGLSLGLRKPIFSLPTACLLKKPAALPLRHLWAEKLSPEEYFQKGFEAIVLDPKNSKGPFPVIQAPQKDLDYIAFSSGLQPLQSQNILEALPFVSTQDPGFHILYGLTPKISGQRVSENEFASIKESSTEITDTDSKRQ